MKIFLVLIFLTVTSVNYAQIKSQQLIDGGKSLVELITLLKKNKPVASSLTNMDKEADSCAIKLRSDLCFKNSSSTDLTVSIFKRKEEGYEEKPFTMKVITKMQECLYELRSGIYKYRIEKDAGGVRTVFREGELKLQPCDNMQREITE